MANLEFCDKHNMVAYLQKSEGSEGFHQIVDFLSTSHIRYALTESPTISVSLIEQFWQTATTSTLENGDMEITTTIDGKVKTVSEASIRRYLKLEDSKGISDLPTTEIFEHLALMGNTKRTSKGYTGGGHSIVSNNACPGLDFTRQETKVPQPSSPTQTHVADEAASIGMDDRHGGAATIVFGLDEGQGSGNINKTPTMPHDSPLPRVHTLGSDEGRMQQNELMELVTKLTYRVEVLENDLKQTKKVYGVAFTKLIKKVKTLKKTVKSSKARRRAKFVVSNAKEEDSFNQGRKIAKINEDTDISLFTAYEEVYTAKQDISTANVPVSIVGVEVSTAIPEVSTIAKRFYIRRSAAKRIDKGKAIIKEDEFLQEEIDAAERQRIAQVHQVAQGFTKDEWEDIRARVEVDEELTQRLQAEERDKYNEVDQAKMLDLFETTMKRVKEFVPMESDKSVPKIAAGSSKRDANEELNQESYKRQKTREGSEPAEESEDKESDELTQEQLQELMIIVPEEGMNVEALQTKFSIIDWEVDSEDTMEHWKIIRVGDHIEVYKFFEDMLKNLDKDDLVKLWSLVHERFNLTESTEDKERELWVKLKSLFEPNDDDELWKCNTPKL
ncbi:hypothetical protein Tco_0942544, partial [Tanacetum coccineum]